MREKKIVLFDGSEATFGCFLDTDTEKWYRTIVSTSEEFGERIIKVEADTPEEQLLITLWDMATQYYDAAPKMFRGGLGNLSD
jgi:hypothetical protein